MPSSGPPNLPGGHTFAGPKVAKRARRHGVTYRACAGGCRLQKRGAIDQTPVMGIVAPRDLARTRGLPYRPQSSPTFT
jgi:hypothetical protein